jgi:hypothetical protein
LASSGIGDLVIATLLATLQADIQVLHRKGFLRDYGGKIQGRSWDSSQVY